MRAKMSTVDGGPAFLRAPLHCDVTGRTHVSPDMASDNAFAARQALSEARAILHEVENEHCGNYQRLTWFGGWSGEVADLISAFVED